MKDDQDNIFTLLVVLQEVSQRLLSCLIDDDIMRRKLKKDFNMYLNFGEKFRDEYLKMIRQIDHKDPEEHHEQDADFMFDVLFQSSFADTDEQQKKILRQIKEIVNDKRDNNN